MSSDPPNRPQTRSSSKRSRVDVATTANLHRPTTRFQVGNFGTRLAQITNNDDTITLFGTVPSRDTPHYQTLQLISQFLAQQELARAAAPSADNNHVAPASYYLPTLEEFARTQMDRQAAGLRTNVDRETAAGVSQLVEGHAEALQLALQEPFPSLCSDESLCTVHNMLFKGQAGSGEFRTTRVRAGQTHFCPPEDISREIGFVWSSLIRLKEKYFAPPTPNSDIAKIYHAIALAATTMYAISDIHPFLDGNGRTSRIYVNALLKHLINLPFTITIVATPQQRQEYVDALRKGQRQLEDCGAMQPSSEAILEPLIHVIMDRITHAIAGLQTLLTERARAALDEEEARIARRVRERAAQGQCVICLDANPNIATLCCGQAVHLNCIAEWLANGTTCVSCRKPLPRLSVANRASSPPRNDGHNNLVDAYEAVQHAVQRAIQLQNQLDGVQNAQTDDTTEFSNEDETVFVPPQCPHCHNRAAVDCGNQMCGRCCAQSGRGNCERHGTAPQPLPAPDDTTTYTDDENDETAPAPPGCTTCNNVAASDCPNNMCGRCCRSLGRYGCQRHREVPVPEENTTTDETEEDTPSDTTSNYYSAPPRQNHSSYCPECNRNRAALDCANNMCGRCCLMTGLSHRCSRHGM